MKNASFALEVNEVEARQKSLEEEKSEIKSIFLHCSISIARKALRGASVVLMLE